MEDTYEIRDGRRHVRPYNYTFTSFAKRRWVGRRVFGVLEHEFPERCSSDRTREDAQAGRLRLNGRAVTDEDLFRDGDRLEHDIVREEPSVPYHPIAVLDCELSDVIALHKPAGVPVHHAGRFCRNTLVEILQAERPELVAGGRTGRRDGLHVFHRLDRGVSGVLLLPLTKEAAAECAALLEAKCFTKLYVARVHGQMGAGAAGSGSYRAVDQPILTTSDAGVRRRTIPTLQRRQPV